MDYHSSESMHGVSHAKDEESRICKAPFFYTSHLWVCGFFGKAYFSRVTTGSCTVAAERASLRNLPGGSYEANSKSYPIQHLLCSLKPSTRGNGTETKAEVVCCASAFP